MQKREKNGKNWGSHTERWPSNIFGSVGSEAPGAAWINDKFPQAANELLIQWSPGGGFTRDEGGSRGGMEGNSTAGSFAPSQQFSVADLVVVVLYFSLNIAVGIWVRAFFAFRFLL